MIALPTLAQQPDLNAQRRARIEMISTAVRTLPWKLAGDADVTVGQDPEPRSKFQLSLRLDGYPNPGAKRRARGDFPDFSTE